LNEAKDSLEKEDLNGAIDKYVVSQQLMQGAESLIVASTSTTEIDRK